MELRQLELFVAVAEERHFARAAARCSVVPSAASTSIRLLERELGVPLLRRTTRSVSLTEAGSAFLVEAIKCLAAAAAARAAVGDVRGLLGGSLTVGGIPTPGMLDQAGLLRRFNTDHPKLSIKYVRGTSAALVDDVRTGRLDVAIVSLPELVPADLSVVEVGHGTIMVACHASHRLAGRDEVTVEELADEVFVACQPGSRGRDYIGRIFQLAGRPGNVPYEVNDIATMLEFVEQNLGVALTVAAMTADRPALRAIPIADASFGWTVGAIALGPEQVAPAARAFMDLIIDVTRPENAPFTIRH